MRRDASMALAVMLATLGGPWANYTPVPRRERNDSERFAAAVAKRERKNAKRLGDFRTMGLVS